MNAEVKDGVQGFESHRRRSFMISRFKSRGIEVYF